MTSRLKNFFIALVLSLPFWWGINTLGKDLTDIFFWQEANKNPQIFTAQIDISQYLENRRPGRDKNIPDLEVIATSGISVLIKNSGEEKILFEKNTDQRLPIASLSKLMTALVVLDNYDLSKEITVSKEAVSQEENFGKLETGNVFTVEYLLYPLLMESSNDAAFSLANDYDGMTVEKFVDLMNYTGQKLNLTDTFFVNPSGLDPEPEEPQTKINYSTVTDLEKLTKELLKKPLIWEILSTQKYNLYGPELINTNELLGEIAGVLGGKTGYTDTAGGCMVLVTRAPKDEGLLINVILGSDGGNGRFGEMKKLVNWANAAYNW